MKKHGGFCINITKKKGARLLGILLTLVMVCSMLPMTALTEDAPVNLAKNAAVLEVYY